MDIFDLHSDTMMDIVNKTEQGKRDVLSTYHIPQYRRGEVGAIIYALWTTNDFGSMDEYFSTHTDSAQEAMIRMLARSFDEFRNTDAVEVALNTEDIRRIRADGRIAVLLGFEGFYGFCGEPGMVNVMHSLGFRHGMLTWDDDNEFASGASFTGEDKGLTAAGRDAVRRMEQLHMLIDVSHASEKTFWDIMEQTSCPIMASHSNAASLCSAPRNLKDEQIRAIAESGGVIGLNSWKGFICEDQETSTVADLARHAAYIADLVGPEYVACGFDFCDYFDENDGTPGIMNAGESQNFISALKEEGFTGKELEGIAWNNGMRMIRSVIG